MSFDDKASYSTQLEIEFSSSLAVVDILHRIQVVEGLFYLQKIGKIKPDSSIYQLSSDVSQQLADRNTNIQDIAFSKPNV
jgi:hypothetical protein